MSIASITTRNRSFILVSSPGALEIRSKRFVAAGHGHRAWIKIDAQDVGKQLSRSLLEDQVIYQRNNHWSYDGSSRWDSIDINPGKCLYNSTVDLAEQQKLIEHHLEAYQRVLNGETKWYEEVLFTPAWSSNNYRLARNRRLNIGGYLVTSTSICIARFTDYERNDHIDVLSVSHKSPLDDQVATHVNNCWEIKIDLKNLDIIYLEALTLIDPATGKPDLEKTAEWHSHDSERVASLRKTFAKTSIGGGYYIEEIGPCLTIEHEGSQSWDNFPQDLPTPAQAIADINTRFVLAGCSDVVVTQATWTRVRTRWQEPIFGEDGLFEDHSDEQLIYHWGLRIGITLNGEVWCDSNTHFWASYAPEKFPSEPWRLLKSTACQRQSRWSKYDKEVGGFYHQVEPGVTWSIIDWCTQSLSQLTDKHPESMKPIFTGSEYEGSRRVDNFKDRLKDLMLEMKTAVEAI